MKRLWIAAGMALAGLWLIFGSADRLYVPQPIAETRTENALPDIWSFAGTDGRKADISMPVLQRFAYPGDAAFCDKIKELGVKASADGDAGKDCGSISQMQALQKAEALAETATRVAFQFSGSDEPADKDRDETLVVLAMGALREAMRTVPRDAPDAALAILDRYWIASLLKQPERYFQPAFLFKDTFVAEVTQARLALCTLSGDPNCADNMPPDAAEALQAVGRWRSDLGTLLLSIKLAEASHSRGPQNNPTLDIGHAQDLAGTYGYASETVSGDEKLIYLRRGVGLLEQAYERYKGEIDAETNQSVIGSLGTIYGRIAAISRDREDVEKALRFDEDGARLQKQLTGDTSWEKLSNVGDSRILRGEVLGDEEDLRTGLGIQRQALDKAIADASADGKAYVTMKLAQSLVRYVEVPRTALSRQQHIDMLTEARRLAAEAEAFFRVTRTPTYLSLLSDVTARANIQLSVLGVNFVEHDDQTVPPPQKP